MSNANNTRSDHTDHTSTRRLTTETKASTKTTELFMYLGAVLAVVITAIMVNDDGGAAGGNGVDPFSAHDAIQFITYLTIGYMIARGLAKSGSRDAYDA